MSFLHRILKLSSSIRQSDKQIRNEFTILTILIVKKHPPLCTVFWDSGYTKSIKEFVVNEYEGKGNSVMTFSYDDLEYKRVCLYLLEILCRDLRLLEYLIEERFIEHLFEYLNFNSTNPVVQGWSERQLKTLQLQILRFLATLFSLPSLSDQAIALSRNKLLLFYLHDAKIYDNGQPRQHQYAAGEITGLVLSVVKLIGVLGNINDDCKSALGEVGFVEELIGLTKIYYLTFV
ncbi:hypothetical protein BKA69DRAFT_1047798 [Paraphysoderma sedebokerense]|nr:hypothetical protein BKA69DRAFT_1047798 [Paraphysoderma sedebokerense]